MRLSPIFSSLVLVVAFAAGGCKQNPAGSAAGGESAAAPACADYAKKVCDAAAGDRGTCDAVKLTSELLPPSACQAALAKVDFSVGKLGDLKKACNELADRLCKDLGEETQTCEMVRKQTPRFPPAQCKGMLSDYDKVLGDLKKRESANKPLDAEKQAAIAASPMSAFGPEGAKVTVVEFSDFQCPYCSKAASVVTDIKKAYADKVRFVFRQFPLSFHKEAHVAAQATLAAGAQGKFWEYHDMLFANQKALDRPSLDGYAKKLGLDVARFKKELDDKTHAAQVDADLKLGESIAVSGTPTMFVNGERVSNPTDFEAVKKLIDKGLTVDG